MLKAILVSLAVKVILIAAVLGVLFLVFQKEVEKRVHNRLELAVKFERLKEDREWKHLTRRQVAELHLTSPRDGVNRSRGWHWSTKDREYRLTKGLFAGDYEGTESPITGAFEQAESSIEEAVTE